MRSQIDEVAKLLGMSATEMRAKLLAMGLACNYVQPRLLSPGGLESAA
jgi:hypothetical protein